MKSRKISYRPFLHLLRWFGHQHWILRGRDRVIRIFANPDNIVSTQFEVDFFGLRYRGNLQSFIDWHVFFYGCWARNELLLLEKLVSSLRVSGEEKVFAFDVGANVGNHSLFLSTICDHVYAFEPYGYVRGELEEKISDNRVTNITVFPVGLGEKDEDLDYFVSPGLNSGEGSFVVSGEVKLKLPVRHGDRFFADEQLPKLGVLKVDVEGFDGFVLRGLRERINRDRPVIMTELSKAAREQIGDAAAFGALFPDDYRFFEVGTKSISGPFKLAQFQYETSREVVVVPKELMASATLYVPSLLAFK